MYLKFSRVSFTILCFLAGISSLLAQEKIISVQLDYENPQSRTITIDYSLSRDFDLAKKTILLIEDPLDQALGFNHLFDRIDEGDFNVIRIKGRYFSEDLKTFLKTNNHTWNQKYTWLNHDQVIRDIEKIRKRILEDKRVILVGFGASTSLHFHYLNSYPDKVEKLIAFNPLLLDVQENLNFWNLFESLSKLDSSSLPKELSFDIDSTEPYFFYPSSKKDSLFTADFQKYEVANHSLETGFFTDIHRVRSFEILPLKSSTGNSPILEYLRKSSEPIRNFFSSQPFSVSGLRYDEGIRFQGQVITFGALNNLIIDPKTFDALVEFYQDGQTFLLKDGYSLEKTRALNFIPEIIEAFVSDKAALKVQLLNDLKRQELLYQGKNYNNIIIGQ